MEELKELLTQIDDSYFDFISAVLHYAEKKESRLHKLISFLKENPEVKSSDVVRFVSDQPDFYEDVSYVKAG